MKNLIISVLLLGTPLILSAKDLQLSVKGMKCSFCAQGIESRLQKFEAVSGVKVDLDNNIVKVSLKDGMSLSESEIRDAIKDAGYELQEVKN